MVIILEMNLIDMNTPAQLLRERRDEWARRSSSLVDPGTTAAKERVSCRPTGPGVSQTREDMS
jgi:hypothetical protein